MDVAKGFIAAVNDPNTLPASAHYSMVSLIAYNVLPTVSSCAAVVIIAPPPPALPLAIVDLHYILFYSFLRTNC